MHILGEKNNALKNSMMAFIEGILEDLNSGNSGKLLMFANSKIHFLILEFNSAKPALCEQVGSQCFVSNCVDYSSNSRFESISYTVKKVLHT
jgi:hypothetical protein